MNTLEQLEEEAYRDGVDVVHRSFKSNRIKGLYCDGIIALNDHIETSQEKSCVLAEELGHFYTSSGDILDQSDPMNRKQEHRARLWAYNDRIGLTGLIHAYELGCRNLHEAAEALDVTEEFLQAAVKCYRKKYGIYTTLDDYVIYFEPNLRIGRMFE